MSKLWGGRFSCDTSSILAELNCSLPVDSRLFAVDIDASKVYAEALSKAGILTASECSAIQKGLELVRYDWIEGLIEFKPTDEDVHTVNERRLTELIGDIAQKLHTGRSRNDQVITDMKLWMRKAIREILQTLRMVMEAIIGLAEKYPNVMMPGYTHMQRAQPVHFAHWILSHGFALKEDCARFIELKDRMNVLPLGSGAIAGNPLNVDRVFMQKELGFDGLTQNSMHAVGDRDFVIDFIYNASLASLHMSRLSEDLIIFASREFNFVRISDAFCTGSSLMPQKRNPDSLELVRGISGEIFSCLTGIMMTVKGTPSTYNKDLQFDKKYCFTAFDQLEKLLKVTEGVLRTLDVNIDRMESCLSPDMLATDWSYYLVRKGIPFRKAHHLIGQVVQLAEERNLELTEVPLEDLQTICPLFDIDIGKVANFHQIAETYNVIGGTSSNSIEKQLNVLKDFSCQIKKLQ
ncbi:argininosuccinate lyase [Episyrphus balteatus]|uniref:argininosuccinate lyase n=1 Tax=Episyrphus balteatus TaxID=286459 RepID=UPI002486BB1C|nr:argininosuccinate lyase [Episyrphus balteatus]